jgi:hypothetical protein
MTSYRPVHMEQLRAKSKEGMSLNQLLETDDPEHMEEVEDDDVDLQLDATDADKQVLVMSETIGLLRRHLEQQRKELQMAYKTLREHESQRTDQQMKALAQETAQLSIEQEVRDLKFVRPFLS